MEQKKKGKKFKKMKIIEIKKKPHICGKKNKQKRKKSNTIPRYSIFAPPSTKINAREILLKPFFLVIKQMARLSLASNKLSRIGEIYSIITIYPCLVILSETPTVKKK